MFCKQFLVVTLGGGLPVAQLIKNMPAMQAPWVQSLCWEDLLVKGMASHFSILAWRILWTEEPGGLHSPWGSWRVVHNWGTNTFTSQLGGTFDIQWVESRDAAKHPAAAAKSLQSCPTLCDPIDGSPSGSPIPGIVQARTLEWVAISFFNAWKWSHSVESNS